MLSDRPFPRSLVLFLCLLGAILLSAADRAFRRPGLPEAISRLDHGDLEGEERKDLLRIVLAQGATAGTRHHALAAAMAAVCLQDEERFRQLVRKLSADQIPVREEDREHLPAIALGEPCLRHLLAGWWSERQGDGEGAAAAHGRAGVGARLWHMPLAGRLAAEGLGRD